MTFSVDLQGALDTLLDWRLTVRPPLTIHNTLPVPATFAVWERGVGGASAAEPGGNSYQRSLQQAATHAATAAGKMGHIFASGRYAGGPVCYVGHMVSCSQQMLHTCVAHRSVLKDALHS
jgi:hypothetical protein